MTNEKKQILISLAKNLIINLTTSLNNELDKLSVTTPEKDKEDILNECNIILENINNRLSQLKSEI